MRATNAPIFVYSWPDPFSNMTIKKQIKDHIASHGEPKRAEMQQLHELILGVDPKCKLWFLDGTYETGKVVTNPNIGYGSLDLKYADGSTKEFYRVGLSANKTGISVYIMGLEDKKFLPDTFGNTIGKATVTGYCIRFKSVKDINLDVLESAVRVGFENQRTSG